MGLRAAVSDFGTKANAPLEFNLHTAGLLLLLLLPLRLPAAAAAVAVHARLFVEWLMVAPTWVCRVAISCCCCPCCCWCSCCCCCSKLLCICFCTTVLLRALIDPHSVHVWRAQWFGVCGVCDFSVC